MFPKFRLKLLIRAFIFVGIGATITQARAEDELLGEYAAMITERDRVSASGEPHVRVADVLGQDRLNFHCLGKGDLFDESDDFFASKSNRDLIPAMLARRPVDNEAADIIVYGKRSIIMVSIYRSAEGDEYFKIIAD